MAAHSEISGTRNLSRAHWQRSVGSVVVGRMADDALRERAEQPLPDIDIINNYVHLCRGRNGLSQLWARVYVVSGLLHQMVEDPYADTVQNATIQAGFEQHTFTRSPERALEEGFNTQAVFPVNLAWGIERAAYRQRVKGYDMRTLEDVADMFRRPDFRSLVDQSALTKNGYWGSNSTGVTYNMFETDDFVFDDSGVRFSEARSRGIRQAIREVNQGGAKRRMGLPHQPSSGCPVRHVRPHFTPSAQDQANLAMLSQHYGVPAEALLAPRPQSVIYDALDFVAGALEAYSPGFEQIDMHERECVQV